MAKITDGTYPLATTLDADDVALVVEDGAVRRADQATMTAWVGGGGGGTGTVTTANSPNANEFARFTAADIIEGRTVSETRTDLSITVYDTETAQDAIGAMVDTTLTYTDATPALGRAALTGAVTAAAGSNTTAIAADAVTNTALANMAQSTVKGRAAGAGTGDPTDLTTAQLTALVDAATTTTAGRVELATNAESVTGTDTARASTPAGVAAKVDDALTAANVALLLQTITIDNADPAPGPGIWLRRPA